MYRCVSDFFFHLLSFYFVIEYHLETNAEFFALFQMQTAESIYGTSSITGLHIKEIDFLKVMQISFQNVFTSI